MPDYEEAFVHFPWAISSEKKLNVILASDNFAEEVQAVESFEGWRDIIIFSASSVVLPKNCITFFQFYEFYENFGQRLSTCYSC